MIDYQRVNEVKRATIGLLSDLWSANFNANTDRIRRAAGVTSLFNSFTNTPAVIVAAGPSLDKNMFRLSAIAGKAIIIAVDTIYTGLVEAGINPDLVITLDPQPEIKRFFQGVNTSGKILVAPSVASPTTLEAWKGDVVFYNKFAPDISSLVRISKANPHLGMLIPGGSVLTVGLDLAFRMGADPIAFIGQDLSYPPGVDAYSKSTIYGEMSMEQINIGREDTIIDDTDIFGRPVKALKSMFVTKQWMEWAFVNFNRGYPARYFNCTEGGVVGTGCEITAFHEWISRYCTGAKRNLAWEIKKTLKRKARSLSDLGVR